MDGEQIQSESRDETPHQLWKQLLGLVFWVGLISFLAGGLPGMIAGLVLGGLTFSDAWVAGIYKDSERKNFLNISPMGWGIAVPMLLFVAFPAYALYRNKLKRLPGNSVLFGSVLAIGGIALAFWAFGVYQLLVGRTGT